jgi:hypothetical protein
MRNWKSNLGAFFLVVVLGGFCCDYSLDSIFDKDIPWPVDCVAGAVTTPLSTTCALGCWVARLCDVETPFVKPESSDAKMP